MKKILLAVLVGSFLYTASALAADADTKQPARRFQGKGGILASLNLTDAQKKDMGKLRTETEKRGVELRAKVATARIELRELLMADNPDQSAIEKKMDEVAKREADLHMNRVNGWFETNKLLTPEQQKVWVKALRVGAMRGMRQGRMNHAPGGAMRRPMGPMHAPAAPPAEK